MPNRFSMVYWKTDFLKSQRTIPLMPFYPGQFYTFIFFVLNKTINSKPQNLKTLFLYLCEL